MIIVTESMAADRAVAESLLPERTTTTRQKEGHMTLAWAFETLRATSSNLRCPIRLYLLILRKQFHQLGIENQLF